MVKPIEVKVTLITCLKCGYEWYPKISDTGSVKDPKLCPSCHQNWKLAHTRKIIRGK